MADRDYDVRSELFSHLLDKVDQDPFPSTTMLDQIEQLMEPQDVPRYARVLIGKIENDNFPSIDLIRRVMDLV